MVTAVGDTVAARVNTTATNPRTRARHVRTAVDLALIGLLGAVLLRLFLWPTLRHMYPFPVGPDVPVYLWWTRVAMSGGVALASERPGAPALIATVTGALDQGLVAGLAGLQYALGPAIGLAAVALARGRGRTLPRGGWLAAGVLAGAWATFLGGGYVSNLVFAAAFIAAAAALARRTRRGTIAAALLLAGGAITHPGFFVVGATVLAVAGTWAWMHEGRFGWNTDAGRVATALLGGGALAATGLVAATLGGARVAGETSTDAFLRATGQLHTLRQSYLDRFLVNWRRYSPFMTVALATAGAFRAHGFARRLLLSWAGVSAVGLALGAATGWYPPDRILMFAFCLPMLAAFGLVALGEWLGRWWLAWPVGLLLTSLIVAPAVRDWRDQFPYISPDEVAHLTLAGRIATDRSQAGTPLVFVADSPDTRRGVVPAHAHRERGARGAARRPGERRLRLPRHPGGSRSPGIRARPAIRATTSRRRRRSIGSPTGSHLTFVVGEDIRDPVELDTPGLTRWDPWLASSEGAPRSAGAQRRRARAGGAAQDPRGDLAHVPAVDRSRAGLGVVGPRRRRLGRRGVRRVRGPDARPDLLRAGAARRAARRRSGRQPSRAPSPAAAGTRSSPPASSGNGGGGSSMPMSSSKSAPLSIRERRSRSSTTSNQTITGTTSQFPTNTFKENAPG